MVEDAYLPHGGHEAKREREERLGPNIPFRHMPPMTSLLFNRLLLLKIALPPNSTTVWWPSL
jgi:hypothetical protein